jgi:hypothetical protein
MNETQRIDGVCKSDEYILDKKISFEIVKTKDFLNQKKLIKCKFKK